VSWYIKQIFAQALYTNPLEKYLTNLGINDDIINYILSLDKQTAQYLTNELRQNFNLTLQQLQSIQLPQKNKDPYSPFEKNVAKNYPVGMQKWILVNMRKIREGRDPNNITQEMSDLYSWFNGKLDEVKDWTELAEPKPELASYNYTDAIADSDKWHKMMAGKGEGVYYEPVKKELIMYGPEWNNKEWNGWTIQKVMSENDLLAEGNKMDHCVGSYCNYVENESIRIYSLRDPSNKPYVTIETDGSGKQVKQIRGNSNGFPDEEHCEMISEWVGIAKNSPKKYNYSSDRRDWDIEGNLDDIGWRLQDLQNGYISDEDEDYDYETYVIEACGFELLSDTFIEWQNNFDVEKLMGIIFEELNLEENVDTSNKLISTIDHFDDYQSQPGEKSKREQLREILKERVRDFPNLPPAMISDNEEGDKNQRELAKETLELMGEPKEQRYFDFSYSSGFLNWYKKAQINSGKIKYKPDGSFIILGKNTKRGEGPWRISHFGISGKGFTHEDFETYEEALMFFNMTKGTVDAPDLQRV